MSLPKIGALLTLCFLSQFTLGATVSQETISQEKEELTSLQRNLSKQETKLSNLKEEIQSLPKAIAKAEKDLAEAEAEYLPEKDSLTKIKIAHTNSPSANTERQLKLAETKFGLAERRYQKAKDALDTLKGKENTLNQELTATEKNISNSQERVRRQRQRVVDAEKAAELSTASTNEKPLRKESLAIATPKITPPKADIEITAPKTPAPKTPAPKPPALEPVITLPEQPTVELTKDVIEELDFAKEKMAEVKQMIAEAPSNDEPDFNPLNLSGSKFDDIPFTYLGNGQYRTDVSLPSGKHSLEIEDLRFRVSVPKQYQTPPIYVFLVDASDKDRIKASYFRKELLDYFNKEVKLVEPELSFAEKVEREGVIETSDGVFMSEDEYEELQFAKEKMTEVDSLVATAPTNELPALDDLTLRNRELGDSMFIHLGNQQYRADKTLPKGRHTFKVERFRFSINVPDNAAQKDYVFLVDGRDKDRLKVSYFRKSLLNYVDKKVAVVE